ncbi:choline dehydrogenase [Sphingobium faniae]|nr:choline dehydrogenase [Sphingobium faniae]
MEETFDFIIVGAGSAGCVLAHRLSADPGTAVLLLEAGAARNDFLVQMPSGYGKIIGDPRYDWCYMSEPEPTLAGRRIFTPRGKLLGGSSSINGLAYVRGHGEDFDHWRQLGNPGWGWDDVRKIYARIENYHGHGADRGRDGPMHVTEMTPHPLARRLMEAAGQAGLPMGRDYNDGAPLGLGPVQSNQWKGRRFSSYEAYLKPALGRPNLKVVTGALVEAVRFEGRTAMGLTYRVHDENRTAICRGDILLSAGGINSARLLELSGIGSAERLRGIGIPVINDLPGVGENLMDHLNVGIKMKLKGLASINEQLRGWRTMLHGARYMLTHSGLLAISPAQVTGYAQVMENAASADIQFWGVPGSVGVVKGSDGENRMAMDPWPGVTLSFDQNRPESRGSTHIRSADPADSPIIRFHYLDSELDREVVRRGLRLVRRILSQPAFDGYRDGPPGPDSAFESDDALIAFAMQEGRSSYHVVGTCKMGVDNQAVVDPRLNVRGMAGLRVVDSSVMPTIVSANTHAATVMIAERAADMILEDRRQALAA